MFCFCFICVLLFFFKLFKIYIYIFFVDIIDYAWLDLKSAVYTSITTKKIWLGLSAVSLSQQVLEQHLDSYLT